ncbi:MAG TPA: glycosyltransferase, partial [Rhodanobacter sp.]|nr:glycosyltransferase [Rhodanobacter sp.]
PAGTPLEHALRWRSRGRVLVVDAMTPEPTRDSGSLRLCAILRLLDKQGWSTAFAADNGRASATELSALGALGVEVLCQPWTTDLPHWLREHGRELHAVILCRHNVAGQYAALVRRHAPQARLLFDTVDLHFLREHRAAKLRGNQTMTKGAKASRHSELALIEQCDITLVVSPYEQKLLAQLAPQARVELLSNIQEIHGCHRGHAGRKDLIFVGGYGHPPNADAIRWMAHEILPRLRAALPDLQLHLFGDIPEAVRHTLATPGLELHGRVADLTPWFDTCLASLAPLRFGAGVKGKINLAMSYGVPVIATTIAVEGMQLQHDSNVLVADDPTAIVAAVIRLQRDAVLWQKLSAGGLANVQQYFSPDAADTTLRRILD